MRKSNNTFSLGVKLIITTIIIIIIIQGGKGEIKVDRERRK